MDVLIIIDMLNGFCRNGYPLSLPKSTTKVEEYIKDLIINFDYNNNKYFFLCDNHSVNSTEFKQYPVHCLKDSIEAEIVDTLIDFSNNKNIVYKDTLSIFYNTKLELELKSLDIENIHLTGVLTDICVLFAAYEFRNRGYNVFIHKKGVQALSDEKQEYFINYINEFLGVEII